MKTFTFTLILILIYNGFAYSQKLKPSKTAVAHEYFIVFSDSLNRTQILSLQSAIQKRNTVTHFLANRYPARYFRLTTSSPVTPTMFKSWISTRNEIEYFGEGIPGKEKAIALFNSKKRRNK